MSLINYIKICTFNNYEIIVLFQFIIYYIGRNIYFKMNFIVIDVM